MKKIIFYSFFLFLIPCSLIISACQKVIAIDVNSVAPQYVIEAPLYEGTHDFIVTITKTGNYFGTDKPTPVINAVINFSKKTNNVPVDTAVKFSYIGDGKYKATNYSAVSHAEYQISILAEGKTFDATDFMPRSIAIDSLELETQKGIGVAKDSFTIFVDFQDPASEKNYYRIKSIVNGVQQNSEDKNLTILDDIIFNGRKTRVPIFTNSYVLNDSVVVELVSLDKKMYDYLNTLSLIVGQNAAGAAAPANPNSNWSNSALGYFGAFASSKKTIVVK